MVAPLSRRGMQPKGRAPLPPDSGSFFTGVPYPFLLHGASCDKAVSARDPTVNSILNF